MKQKLFIATGASLVLLFLFWLAKEHPVRRTLPDGTVIGVGQLKVTRSNIFEHGSSLGKIFGTLIPFEGASIGRWKLERPALVTQTFPQEVLSGEFAAFPPSNSVNHLISPLFYRQHRVVITGDKKPFPYIAELNGFKTFEDGYFAQIAASIFPRDSKILSFRIEERDSPRVLNWRELATLQVENPSPAQAKAWTETSQPEVLLRNGLLIEFGKLEVIHLAEERRDIWEPSALLPVRVTRDGELVNDFGIVEGEVSDSSGNWVNMPTIRTIANNWIVYRMFRPMDPEKLWKFDLRFALHRNYPQSNLFSANISIPFRSALLTNAAEHPVQITVQNDRMINIDLPEKPPDKRLRFVDMQGLDNRGVAQHPGSWSQHSIMRYLDMPYQGDIKIIFAIVEESEASVILKPHVDLSPLVGSEASR